MEKEIYTHINKAQVMRLKKRDSPLLTLFRGVIKSSYF